MTASAIVGMVMALVSVVIGLLLLRGINKNIEVYICNIFYLSPIRISLSSVKFYVNLYHMWTWLRICTGLLLLLITFIVVKIERELIAVVVGSVIQIRECDHALDFCSIILIIQYTKTRF